MKNKYYINSKQKQSALLVVYLCLTCFRRSVGIVTKVT